MEGCIIPPATVRGALLLTGTPTVSAVSTPAVSTLHCISPALAVESTSVSAALNGNTICCTDRAASSRCFNQIVLHSSGSSIKSTAQPVYSIVVLVLMLYLFHLPDNFILIQNTPMLSSPWCSYFAIFQFAARQVSSFATF